MPPELDARHLVRRLLQIGAAVVVIALILLTLPGLDDVRTRMAGAQPAWLVVALIMELGSLLAFVAVFRGVICRHLAWRLSYEIALSEQAANVLLPTGGTGGLALGAWALKRGGMPTEHIARRSVALYVITSSVNFVAAIVPGVALATGLVAGSASTALTLGPAILAVVVIVVILALPRLLPTGTAAVTNGPIRKRLEPVAAAVRDGIHDAVALVISGQPLVVVGAVAYMAFDVATLAAAFQAFGGGPPIAALVLAYTLGQLGGLLPVPGGIGGTDGALIIALAIYGSPIAEATVAVLAYRAFQLVLPAILGTIAFGQLQRTLARSADPAALCAAMAAAIEIPGSSSGDSGVRPTISQ
ncbi:MAG: UPF0104 family protein [Solirubrobacterales bacterium]|nr:UPF0104 family protein [Solirubrobacterales bacterium]